MAITNGEFKEVLVGGEFEYTVLTMKTGERIMSLECEEGERGFLLKNQIYWFEDENFWKYDWKLDYEKPEMRPLNTHQKEFEVYYDGVKSRSLRTRPISDLSKELLEIVTSESKAKRANK